MSISVNLTSNVLKDYCLTIRALVPPSPPTTRGGQDSSQSPPTTRGCEGDQDSGTSDIYQGFLA
jgi:hypothetical protein